MFVGVRWFSLVFVDGRWFGLASLVGFASLKLGINAFDLAMLEMVSYVRFGLVGSAWFKWKCSGCFLEV